MEINKLTFHGQLKVSLMPWGSVSSWRSVFALFCFVCLFVCLFVCFVCFFVLFFFTMKEGRSPWHQKALDHDELQKTPRTKARGAGTAQSVVCWARCPV